MENLLGAGEILKPVVENCNQLKAEERLNARKHHASFFNSGFYFFFEGC